MVAALLVAALAMAPAETPSGPTTRTTSDAANGVLCGLDARNSEKLLAELRSTPEMMPLPEADGFIRLVDPNRQIIWVFTVRGGKAYAAVSCNELGPYQGRLVFRQTVVCNGASEADCKAFYVLNRIRNAKAAEEIEADIGERQ